MLRSFVVALGRAMLEIQQLHPTLAFTKNNYYL
jgi:hypothetical protein